MKNNGADVITEQKLDFDVCVERGAFGRPSLFLGSVNKS